MSRPLGVLGWAELAAALLSTVLLLSRTQLRPGARIHE
jgi:hypothetical protein